MLDFEATVASAPNARIEEAAEYARTTRLSEPSFAALEDELERLDANAAVRTLETVQVFGGDHLFILIAERSADFLLATNVLPERLPDGGFQVSEPGDVRTFEVAASANRRQWFDQAGPDAFESGVSGNPEALDGQTYLLAARSAGKTARTAVHGEALEPLTADVEPLPSSMPELGRYQAVQAVWRFWLDALAAQPTPVRTVAIP